MVRFQWKKVKRVVKKFIVGDTSLVVQTVKNLPVMQETWV